MPESKDATAKRDQLLSRVGYIKALIASRWLIVAGTFLAGLAGVLVTMVMPEQFTSSATLVVRQPPFRQAPEVNMLMPGLLTVVDYRILFTSDGILMKAAERAKANGNWDAEDLELLGRISYLRKALTLVVEVAQKTVSTTQYSPMVILSATSDSPEHARDLVHAWAEVCEEISRESYEQGKTGLLEVAKEQFDSTRVELEQVGGKIRDAEIDWNDELARAQLLQVHERYLDYVQKMTDRKIEIETSKKELEKLEASFAEESERIVLFKSPPMEAIFLNRDIAKSEERTGYESEEMNPVYLALKEKINLKRSELASIEEFVRQMESQLDGLSTELQTMREEIAVKAFERKMLNMEETPHLRSYDKLSGLVEQAKVVESEGFQLSDVKIISDAVLPDRKSWPPRSLFVLLAGFSGFCISVGLVLLRQALNSDELNLAGA